MKRQTSRKPRTHPPTHEVLISLHGPKVEDVFRAMLKVKPEAKPAKRSKKSPRK